MLLHAHAIKVCKLQYNLKLAILLSAPFICLFRTLLVPYILVVSCYDSLSIVYAFVHTN
jgi:hypothetical protein